MSSLVFDLFIGTDNLITGAWKVPAGPNANADLSGATVTFDLTDVNGVSVASGSLTYDSQDSESRYVFYGTIPDDTALIEGDKYTLSVTVNAGAGLQLQDKQTGKAKYL